MNGAKLFIIVQISVSRLDKLHLPPIPFFRRPDGEVYPIASLTIALNQEFVIVLLAVISGIEQDGGIAYRLLHANATDIHGAARQMIARISPAHGPVHVWRTVTAGDDNRLHIL